MGILIYEGELPAWSYSKHPPLDNYDLVNWAMVDRITQHYPYFKQLTTAFFGHGACGCTSREMSRVRFWMEDAAMKGMMPLELHHRLHAKRTWYDRPCLETPPMIPLLGEPA